MPTLFVSEGKIIGKEVKDFLYNVKEKNLKYFILEHLLILGLGN